jgi:hypothetical protein
MGADIHGFVECRATFGTLDGDDAHWHAAINLDLLYAGRDYDTFARLFGVRNRAGHRPLAEGRGLPADVTEPARHNYESWAPLSHSASWISWAELAEAPGERQAGAAPPDDTAWGPVRSVMRALAAVHGAANVRLTVFFDS